MKAKTAKQPKSKKENLEPVQAAPELSLEEIQKKIDFYDKLIVNSKDFAEYKSAWDEFDKYNELKRKFFKK